MARITFRLTSLLAGATLTAICLTVLPPVVQDPGYHVFADSRPLHGIPNFWNVISNFPFFLVALAGIGALRRASSFTERWERMGHLALLTAVAAVGAGSAYYHWHPDDGRLFWDRLPMALAFMALAGATIGERISLKLGRQLLVPLLILGAASVIYWRLSGDLRLYGLIQFGALLAIPLMLVLRPSRYRRAGAVWWTIAGYGAAKILELCDRQIGAVISTGGHPWKHLAAACAVFAYFRYVARRSHDANP